ncbi:EXS family-domain-containing protein [Emericellopsis atlantica]|uniref:EXS family-domain-containing protein n=1 Tax=Emericellopsis atlantica TaxID=2614577 RepID=A0A9P7ZT36_9HYPO|nr:EXS family-domain-containing protein [Emericellopsis atlantica]KAG9257843.1 EXS family-domain-containing protein [Emericellopsis atlantica]
MDGDPAVEPELDSFSLTFPLPYRVGFIVTLAVWGWGLNLHCLYRCNIDVPSLIKYPTRTSPHHVPHHFTTYRLATVLSGLFGVSITLFWLLTWRIPSRVIAYDWLPLTYLVALLAVFLVPIRDLPSAGRRRFLSTFRRIAIGGIAQAQDGKFGDILMADVLTSYAKVVGDLYVSMCMFFRTGGSATHRPDRDCGGTVFVPLLMAIPSLIRFRQCIIEYFRVKRAPYKESTGWGGQHLANALKYSTAFPVIITSTLQRNTSDPDSKAVMNKLWLFAVLINSLYSFYWDVAKDWDLTLFAEKRERAAAHHPWGLRERLMFRPVNLYYVVIGLDLMLRCTWSMKLSPHLDKFSDFESGIFLIEFLEVFRRWVWIFFRTEAEWLRHSGTGGLGVDDILLRSVQGKDDDSDDDDLI